MNVKATNNTEQEHCHLKKVDRFLSCKRWNEQDKVWQLLGQVFPLYNNTQLSSEIPNGTTSIFWIARITVEKSVIKKIYVQKESHFENEAYGDNDLQFLFAITALKNKTTLVHIKLQ